MLSVRIIIQQIDRRELEPLEFSPVVDPLKFLCNNLIRIIITDYFYSSFCSLRLLDPFCNDCFL